MPIKRIPPLPAPTSARSPAAADFAPAAGGLLTVDLAAIEANYRHLARLAAPARVAGVVKADAYGLGAVPVTRRLIAAGCRHFFVALLSEAIELRPLMPAGAMLAVLNGLAPGSEREAAVAGIVPVLNSLAQLRAWAALAHDLATPLPAILQVDTGMSRLGLSPSEVDALADDAGMRVGLDLLYVMSHLGCADEPTHPANRAQLAVFTAAKAKLGIATASLANSAGIFLGPDYHFDLCRPGAAVYGLDVGPAAHGIRPVIGLKARVAQIRTIPAGASIGYGYTFTATLEMRLATLSVGYADGWPRALGNVGAAFIDGVSLPFTGRVSMDSATIDISALPKGRLAPGSLVDLIAAEQSADDVGRLTGTIGYEILTNIGRRYARRYIG